MALKMAAKNNEELSSDEIRRQIEEAEKLIAEKQKLKRRLNRKITGVVEREARAKEDRMKNHAGGMMRMLGLFDYVYPDAELHDNNQDALIENLLVGGLLRVAQKLAKSELHELHELYNQGKAFRDLAPENRVVPKTNPKLYGLFDILRTSNGNESKKIDCQNVYDNDKGGDRGGD